MDRENRPLPSLPPVEPQSHPKHSLCSLPKKESPQIQSYQFSPKSRSRTLEVPSQPPISWDAPQTRTGNYNYPRDVDNYQTDTPGSLFAYKSMEKENKTPPSITSFELQSPPRPSPRSSPRDQSPQMTPVISKSKSRTLEVPSQPPMSCDTPQTKTDNYDDPQNFQKDPPKSKRKHKSYAKLKPGQMHFSVDDIPPWYLCIFLGFQHYLIMFGATAAIPLALAGHLCMEEDQKAEDLAEIIGTILFSAGISTLLQTFLGSRLPIVQGGSFTFLLPAISLLSLEKWKCPDRSGFNSMSPLTTNASMSPSNGTEDLMEPLWKPRMRELQGGIMVASLFQIIIGFSGIIGFLLRFIGPLSVAPTISLIGLALFDVATGYAQQQWWIALATVILIAAFSQYTKNINIPCFAFNRKEGCHKIGLPLFRLFPVISASILAWAVYAILVTANVLEDTKNKRVFGIQVLQDAPWLRFPYPGQWGTPTVSAAGVFGMLAAILGGIVESVGDYYACARKSGVPPPPSHAINRGIGIEGLCCILCGSLGTGTGTSSYSENIGAIGITKVASRRVVQFAALIMVFFSVFLKFGTVFVIIPDPVIGGILIVMFGMITAVGISNLHFVDLNSTRNLFIIGFSFFFGLTLPKYLAKNSDVVRTGSNEVDQIILVFLQTSMFVGGISGFILDNAIPGTEEERGIMKWRQQKGEDSIAAKLKAKKAQFQAAADGSDVIIPTRDPLAIYDFPRFARKLRRWKWTEYVPFLPTFKEEHFQIKCKNCEKKNLKKVVTLNLKKGIQEELKPQKCDTKLIHSSLFIY